MEKTEKTEKPQMVIVGGILLNKKDIERVWMYQKKLFFTSDNGYYIAIKLKHKYFALKPDISFTYYNALTILENVKKRINEG